MSGKRTLQKKKKKKTSHATDQKMSMTPIQKTTSLTLRRTFHLDLLAFPGWAANTPPFLPTFVDRLNGVNRQPSNVQKFNRQPSKKGKFYRQPSKSNCFSRQMVLRSFKCHSFNSSSRTAGSQRIVLSGTTSFHVPKYTHRYSLFFSFNYV